MEKREPYFKGDRAAWTGKKEMRHGAEFWEMKLLEGHRKGEFVWQDPTHWVYRGTTN